MIVSISEAARLARRSRQTLYAMRDRGELSFTTDDVSGTSALDMAELCRVFPHIKPDSVGQPTVVNSEQPLTTAHDSLVVRALQAQIDALERLLAEKDQRIMLLEDMRTEKLSELVSKITPENQHPEVSAAPAPQQTRQRGFLDRLADGLNAALKG